MKERDGSGESMLMALVRSRASTLYGSQKRYAASLGLNEVTASRWFRGSTNLLSSRSHEGRRRVIEETGRTEDELRLLGSISVEKGADLLIERLQEFGPDGEDLHKRFLELIRARGESIPSAAYAMFWTGDPASRSSIVNLLEEHGDRIPVTLPSETLELLLGPPNTITE